MNPLFQELEREASRTIGIKSTPQISHADQFSDSFKSSSSASGFQRRFHHEEILINGRKKLIRRVYIYHPNYSAYRVVGWVLFCDIHSCMICSKNFPRLIGKKYKFHCKICGNIICKDCIKGMVKITELSIDYVEACSNCYWGQDEISITPGFPIRNDPPTEVSEKTIKDIHPPIIINSAPDVIRSEATANCNDFYTHYDIEEYDGPSTLHPSLVSTIPSQSMSEFPSPLSLHPRNDSLCYSEGLSYWSESGLLAGELLSQSPEATQNNARIVSNCEDCGLRNVEATADIDYVSDPSDDEVESLNPSENEEIVFDEEQIVDISNSNQTANQAQLMLLLMSLSIANPSELTEEEAKEYIRNADRIALEELQDDDS